MIYAPHALQQLKLSPQLDFHSWEQRKVARNCGIISNSEGIVHVNGRHISACFMTLTINNLWFAGPTWLGGQDMWLTYRLQLFEEKKARSLYELQWGLSFKVWIQKPRLDCLQFKSWFSYNFYYKIYYSATTSLYIYLQYVSTYYISAYKVSAIDRLKNISDFWPSTPITQPLQTQSFPGWWHFRGFAIYAPHLILDHVCSCPPPPPPPPAVYISYNTREWIVKCGELGELKKWKWSAATEQSSCQSGPHSSETARGVI